jgi:hypothetical protein
MADVKLTFGWRDGEYIHISHVDRGLKCNCQCPGCKADLVAKKGEDTAHHFAHRAKTDCTYKPETALHDYAKRLIARQLAFTTPFLYVAIQDDSYRFWVDETVPGKEHAILSGAFEQGFKKIVPDVQFETDAGLLFVEVAVTHFVDREKRSKLRRYGIPTVEIDLSKIALDTPLEEIDKAVLSKMSLRKWAFHPDEFDLQTRLRKQLQEKIAQYEYENWRDNPYDPDLDDDDRHEDDDGEGWDLLIQAADDYGGEMTHEWLQSIPQNRRIETYKTLNHLAKLTYHCFLLDRRPETLPLLFNRRDAVGPPFLCPSIVWRTGVFFRFVVANAERREFRLGDVLQWCRTRYDTFSYGTGFDDPDSLYTSQIDIDDEVTEFLLELEREGYLESDGFIAKRRVFIPAIKYLPNWSRFKR